MIGPQPAEAGLRSGILAQAKVSAAAMAIGEIRVKEAAEMPLIDDDRVVQTLAAKGPDHAHDVQILPGTDRARDDVGDAQAGDPPTQGVVVDVVAVPEEPMWGGVGGKGLDQLPGGPRGRRMFSAVDAYDAAGWAIKTVANRMRPVSVDTVKKSIETRAERWLARKVRHV